VVNARDITQRRIAEQALRESEARYRSILQHSSDAIFIMDAHTLVLQEANPTFYRLLGYTAQDMGQLNYYALADAPRAQIEASMRLVQLQGQLAVGERNYRHANGTPIAVDVNTSALVLNGQQVIVLVARDISERKQKEQELAQHTAELAALYRASARLLNPGEDVEQLAQQIVNALTQEFEFADCGLMLVNEKAGELKRLARAGPYEVRTAAPLYLSGKGLTVSAVRENQIVYAADVMTDARYVPNESRTRSELAVPLRHSGQVIGVLDLQSEEPQAFDERAVRVITAFAERAELALANALLVERLNQSRRMAEDASRLKSEFLANTSHELRTPLTGILGSLSLILNDECETTEEAKQFAQIAYDSARNLLTIVNDLLDVAKIEAGKMNVQLQLIEVSALLAEVYMLMFTTASRKNLELRIHTLPEPVYVWADTEKLKQILINLIGNAIKFTEKGHVRVEVNVDQPHVHILVTDTGIGIPLEKQTQLFRPFVQVDGTTTRRYGGTGLGLSISRSLVQLLGGSISLESDGEGHGSTFTVTLHHADPESQVAPKFA
jgi:PAS domain S-box-containing protein